MLGGMESPMSLVAAKILAPQFGFGHWTQSCKLTISIKFLLQKINSVQYYYTYFFNR